jgi:hypothetical protein
MPTDSQVQALYNGAAQLCNLTKIGLEKIQQFSNVLQLPVAWKHVAGEHQGNMNNL